MPARKNSKKRQVILEALAATTAHPTAQELYQQLKPDYPDLSLGTVYRNLSLFAEEGDAMSVGGCLSSPVYYFDHFVYLPG